MLVLALIIIVGAVSYVTKLRFDRLQQRLREREIQLKRWRDSIREGDLIALPSGEIARVYIVGRDVVYGETVAGNSFSIHKSYLNPINK